MNENLTTIQSKLNACGFKEEDIDNSYFTTSFTARGLITNLTFLIKEINEENCDATAIKQIVDMGRKWCVTNLKAHWFVKEAGLNIIFLHNGEVEPSHIKGQVDSTGNHNAICQSVTSIDTAGHTDQEKTWIVIGKVKKALKKLNEKA
jgi:hypothetical protein